MFLLKIGNDLMIVKQVQPFHLLLRVSDSLYNQAISYIVWQDYFTNISLSFNCPGSGISWCSITPGEIIVACLMMSYIKKILLLRLIDYK